MNQGSAATSSPEARIRRQQQLQQQRRRQQRKEVALNIIKKNSNSRNIRRRFVAPHSSSNHNTAGCCRYHCCTRQWIRTFCVSYIVLLLPALVTFQVYLLDTMEDPRIQRSSTSSSSLSAVTSNIEGALQSLFLNDKRNFDSTYSKFQSQPQQQQQHPNLRSQQQQQEEQKAKSYLLDVMGLYPEKQQPQEVSKKEDQIMIKMDGVSSSFQSSMKLHDEEQRSAPEDKQLMILIPFRDKTGDEKSQGKRREENLHDWIQYMRKYLPQTVIQNSIVVIVEQTQQGVFNKGLMFNAGYDYMVGGSRGGTRGDRSNTREEDSNRHVDYMILHDVDQIPQDTQSPNIYYYAAQPAKLIQETTRKRSVDGTEEKRGLDKNNVGGALLITPNQYERVNGYSNNFGGWGGEDTNMAKRITKWIGKYEVYSGKFRELYHDRVWGLDENEEMKRNVQQLKDFDSGLSTTPNYYSVVNVTKSNHDGWPITRILVNPTYQQPKLNEFLPEESENTCHMLFGRQGNFSTSSDNNNNIAKTAQTTETMIWLYDDACFQHRRLGAISCHFGTLKVNWTKIEGSVGGEEVEDVKGRDEKLELLNISSGAFEVLRIKGKNNPRPLPPRWLLNSGDLVSFMNPVVATFVQPSSSSSQTVGNSLSAIDNKEKITLLVKRFDYANPCLVTISMYNTYLAAKQFGLLNESGLVSKQGNPIQIVWLDGHAKGAMDDVWKRLFTPHVYHVRQLASKETTLPNTIVVQTRSAMLDDGIKSRKWGESCDATSELHQFRNFVLQRYGIVRKSKPTNSDTGKPLITFLTRQDYVAHPRSNGETDRKLAKPDQDIRYIRNKYGPGYDIEIVSFENLPFEDQLKQIAKTDILLAVHGAGNIHVLFLPDHARMVEFAPEKFQHRKRFKYLAECLGIPYEKQEAFIVAPLPGDKVTIRINPNELFDRADYVPTYKNGTNTCNSLFGTGNDGTFSGGNVAEFHGGACIQHRMLRWISCRMDVVSINTTQITGSLGGENLESVLKRPEEVELLRLHSGAFTMYSSSISANTIQQDFDYNWQSVVSTSDFANSTALSLAPSSSNTTFLVRRQNYANPCDALAAMYSVFVAMGHYLPDSEALNVSASISSSKKSQIVWLDGHAKGSFDDVWEHLFGTVIHLPQLHQHRLENVVLVNTASALLEEAFRRFYNHEDVCEKSSTLHQFRDFVLSKYGIRRSDRPTDNQRKLLTFLKRKNYKATPQSTGNIDRILAYPDKDISFLTSTFGDTYDIKVVSFEEMSFRDVLEQMAKTDVFVAIHGAGNIHLMFLPDHATFIDFVPDTMADQVRFRDLAHCLNITYVRETANIVKSLNKGNKGKRITVSLTGDAENTLKYNGGGSVLLNDITMATQKKLTKGLPSN